MSISSGEFGFIDIIRGRFADIAPSGGVESIGDDCAVIPMGGDKLMVITSDMLVEGVHFLRTMDGYDLGVRSVQVNISDVAAMGAEAKYLLLSISIPEWVNNLWAEKFIEGMRSCGVPLIGGDTTRSKDTLTISITAIGEVSTENIKRRNGAKAGDVIMVSGRLGHSAATSYSTPVMAQMDEGFFLGTRTEVTSMMDVSDGVAGDIRHILEESNLGATMELNNIPIAEGATLLNALSGGEDYKLLFTVNNNSVEKLRTDFLAKFGYELYAIGEITEGNTLNFTENGKAVDFSANGFKHF